jgi:hypothetical protein
MEKKAQTEHYKLMRIRLEQARSRSHPNGDVTHGYDFVAPLNEDGHISLEGWKAERALCFAHRLEHGQIVERGVLTHRAGGAGGATWVFDYDPQRVGDEEAGYRFGAHPFVIGEYVSIRDEDGDMLTYRVSSVTSV